MISCLAIVLVLFASEVAEAGAGTIKGKITDENGLAMPGATVLVTDLGQVGAVTDINGEFTIIDVPEGSHDVKISYLGYQEITKKVDVADKGVSSFSFDLEPGVLLGGEVMILGDRLKGQAKALNQQRSNDNITNVVAADQIGRFPDANAGDALKRVPGITMQGDQGEARNIIIRGLAPQLNSVTLNGNRIPSAEGDNRNIQMDLIPADMIQTIQVNKAILPEMDGDAIGGSVNLVTRGASEGMRVSGSVAGSYNEVGDAPGYNFGLVASNRFIDNKLGAVLSASWRNDVIGSHNVEAEYEYEVEDDDSGEDIETDPFLAVNEIRTYEVTRSRRSVSLNLDYKINNNHTLYAKSMYTRRNDWENRFRLTTEVDKAVFANGVDNAPTGFIGVADRQTKGGIDNDKVRNTRLEDQRVQAYSLSGDHWFDNIQLTWNGAYSKASEERPNERYAKFETDEDLTLDVNSAFSGFREPQLISTSIDENTNSNFVFDKFVEENQYTEEENYTGQIDLKIPLSVLSSQEGNIKLGAKYNAKSKLRDNEFMEYTLIDGDISLADGAVSNKTNADYLAGSKYSAGDFYSEKALGKLNFADESRFEGEDKPDEYLASNYQADENVTAGYIQLTQDLNDEVKVIVGARVEHTDFEYTGNEVNFNEDGDFVNAEPIKDRKSYDNLLPAVHLRYAPSSDLVLRAAWTNSLARPNYYDLVPYRLIEEEEEGEELFLGNSELNPTTSMNIDLMAEYYFQSVGVVSAGLFYKSIDDFIYTSVTEAGDITTFQPKNSGSGSIRGFELSAQRQLDFLPGVWKGFGIYANYTYNASDIDGIASEDGDVRDGIDLPGTADHLFNASLSFETKKLVVRVSANYSSDYIDEVADEEFFDRYYDEQFFLDINASYAVTNNWRVFAEMNNLTNQPLRYYQGIESRTMQVEYYGPKFNLGVKFDLFQK